MKIVLLGATGDTGKPLLRQTLEKGHIVTAILRDPSKLAVEHANLTTIKADVFDPISLAPIFKGHDVVVSVLGFPKQLEETMTKFTESMSAILKAMKEAGVGRVVTISAWYTDRKTRVGQYMFDNMWTKVSGLVNTLNNEGEMDQMLKAQTALDFTSVLVPSLTWDPMTNKDILTADDACFVEDGSGLMPREDVARFILEATENPEKWKRKAVAVAIRYSDEEMAGAKERMMAHMAQHMKKPE